MLVWEEIIEASDTTLVSTEWAIYELSKDPQRQVILIIPNFLIDICANLSKMSFYFYETEQIVDGNPKSLWI